MTSPVSLKDEAVTGRTELLPRDNIRLFWIDIGLETQTDRLGAVPTAFDMVRPVFPARDILLAYRAMPDRPFPLDSIDVHFSFQVVLVFL